MQLEVYLPFFFLDLNVLFVYVSELLLKRKTQVIQRICFQALRFSHIVFSKPGTPLAPSFIVPFTFIVLLPRRAHK